MIWIVIVYALIAFVVTAVLCMGKHGKKLTDEERDFFDED